MTGLTHDAKLTAEGHAGQEFVSVDTLGLCCKCMQNKGLGCQMHCEPQTKSGLHTTPHVAVYNRAGISLPAGVMLLCTHHLQSSRDILQAFRASLQSPDLALCRKDVNTLLGEMDPDAAELDYQSIVPEVYELLSARMVVSLLHLTLHHTLLHGSTIWVAVCTYDCKP